jgi:hypothetical protein
MSVSELEGGFASTAGSVVTHLFLHAFARVTSGFG